MARLDLTRAQERWTIAGLMAVVLLVGAAFFSGREDEVPRARLMGAVLARQIKPGGYILTKVSWAARATAHVTKAPKARREGENDGAGPVEADRGPGEEMPAVFKELRGVPISVGGK